MTTPPNPVEIEHSRVLAADFSTDAERLRALAESPDPETRKAVTTNPNSPPEILLRLGAEFPAQLLDNLSFSLLVLENPDFLANIPLSMLRQFLRQENCPSYLLELAADKADLDLQLAWVNTIQTTPAVLERLTQGRHAQIRQAAQLHVNLAGERPHDSQQNAKAALQTAWATLPVTVPALNSLMVLAHMCELPEKIAACLINDDRYQRCCAALARSPATHPTLLQQLIHHRSSWISGAALENPNLPISLLQQLLAGAIDLGNGLDPSYVVRSPMMSVERLAQLAQDADNKVYAQLMSSARSAQATRAKLQANLKTQQTAAAAQALQDPDHWAHLKQCVMAVLAAFHNTPPAVEQTQAPPCLLSIAQAPFATENILKVLARGRDHQLRHAVATHPNTSLEVLTRLGTDPHIEVRRAVARNLNATLAKIPVQIERERNKTAVQMNRQLRRRCPFQKKWLAEFLQAVAILQVPMDILQLLCQCHEARVRQRVATNSWASATLLETLAYDDHPEVLVKVAAHPATPLPVLLKELARETSCTHIVVCQLAGSEYDRTLHQQIRTILYEETTSSLAQLLQRLIQEGGRSQSFVFGAAIGSIRRSLGPDSAGLACDTDCDPASERLSTASQ